jgi:hypothetical protein
MGSVKVGTLICMPADPLADLMIFGIEVLRDGKN